jgi:hypothetical protein
MARSIPAFSKKSSSGATVSGGGQRSGFTPHVKSTNAGKPKGPPHMAGAAPHSAPIGGKAKTGHPAFKSHSGAAAKSVAAFSKKKI